MKLNRAQRRALCARSDDRRAFAAEARRDEVRSRTWPRPTPVVPRKPIQAVRREALYAAVASAWSQPR